MKSPRTLLLVLVSLPVCGFAQSPSATDQPGEAKRAGSQFDFSLTGGGTWSDNVGLVPVDEQDGTIARAGAQLRYRNVTRRFDSDIDLNTMYEHYTDDTFEDNVVGGADARVIVGIVPERFLWDFQDNFGQVTSDPFAATTPENRENINYFSTGPDFILRFGAATSLKVSARYSDVNFEVSEVDSQQTMATIALMRQTSGSATVGLIGETNNIDFKDEVNPDYDRNQAFLRYQLANSRTELTVDGGYTTLSSDNGDEGGLLARMEMTRQVSSAATLSARLGTEFSDSGDVFRSGQDALGASQATSNVVGSSDPFESRYAILGFDFDRNRTGAGVNLQYRRELYANETSLDRTLTVWSLYFTRRLSARLESRIYADFAHQEFDDSDYESDDTRAGASLSLALGRTISLRFTFDRVNFEGTGVSSEYTENQASLFVDWSPVHRQ